MRTNNGARSKKESHLERTFQDYLGIVIRGKWIILVAFAALVLAAFVYTQLTDPVYKATSTILIDQKVPSIPIAIDGTVRGNIQNGRNEMEILKSRSIADTVARRLLEQKYLPANPKQLIPVLRSNRPGESEGTLASLDEIIGRVAGSVDFEGLRDTDIIKVTARSVNAEEAALIANLYAQAYYDRNIFASRAKSRALREFLESQKKERRKQLDEAEGQLQDYMESQGIVSLDDESRKVIDQLAALEANRDAIDVNLKSLTRTLASYKEQFPQHEIDVAKMIGEANDQYIRGLQDQIAKLEVQKDVTIAQNPNYAGQELYNQKLKEIDDQIISLRAKLQQRTDAFIQTLPASKGTAGQGDPTSYLKQMKQNIAETEIEVQSLEAKKRALNDMIRQYGSQFERIPKKSMQFARLQRSKLSNEKLFLLLESKFNEASIAEQSEFGYISVVDPAVVPRSPASPKLMVNLLIGAFLGLTLGVGFVFVREFLDVKVQTPEDLKKSGHLMLAAILRMDEEVREVSADEESIRFSRDVDPHLVTLLLPFSPIAESYRLLRTALQHPQGMEPPRTIVITSPNPGEGKTTTVCNLAVSIAQAGRRVLLIDCDLRKPNVHNLFSIPMKPGLTELIFRQGAHELAVQASFIKNLDIIAAGTISPNPSEALGSQAMKNLVEQAKREYDVILFDASPVLAATDASVLSTGADAVVVVCSSGTTRVADIERTMEMIQGVGGKVLGFVLNKLDLQRAYGILYAGKGYGYYGYSYHSTNGNGTNGKTKSREKTKRG